MPIEVGDIYQAYDGAIYRVVGFALDQNSNQKVVLYQLNISKNSNGGYDPATWTMPIDNFLGEVEYLGKMVRRFTRIDNAKKKEGVSRTRNTT